MKELGLNIACMAFGVGAGMAVGLLLGFYLGTTS